MSVRSPVESENTPAEHPCFVCGSFTGQFFSIARDRLSIKPGQTYRIFRCRTCGLGWTEPRLAPDELADYYPPIYLGDFEQAIDQYLGGKLSGTSSWRMEVEKVRLIESLLPGGAILDVGCGEGKFLWALDARRWKRNGVELNRPIAEAAQRRIPDLCLYIGTLDTAADLPSSGFSVVTFWHVLEHLPDPAFALAQSFDLLEPGGYLVVSLPKIDSHQAEWFHEHWYPFGDVPRHLFHFSSQALQQLLEQAGFQLHSRVFFSKAVNFHCWKHSLKSLVQVRFRSQIPYLLAKPLLHVLPLLESLTGRPGVSTVIARKPERLTN